VKGLARIYLVKQDKVGKSRKERETLPTCHIQEMGNNKDSKWWYISRAFFLGDFMLNFYLDTQSHQLITPTYLRQWVQGEPITQKWPIWILLLF
jgi:hypothetical protein